MSHRIRVAIVTEGARWAGIEAHISNFLLGAASFRSEMETRVLSLEPGALAEGLAERGLGPVASGGSRNVLELSRCLRGMAPHIVHLHGLLAEVTGGLAAVVTRMPGVVITVHSRPPVPIWRSSERRPSGLLASWLARRFGADRLVAVSEDIRQTLEASRLPPSRIVVIRNGIAVDGSPMPRRPRVSAELGLKESDLVVGVVGRLEAVKGQCHLIEAARLLRGRFGRLRVLLVGDGPDRSSLERAAHDLGERVVFTGHRPDARDLLRLMDVLVIPSTHEGMPYSALEAMADGVPIVASRVGGLLEILSNDVDSRLVNPGRPEELARALGDLLESESLRQRLGASAAHRVRSDYSAQLMVGRTLELYRRILSPGQSC